MLLCCAIPLFPVLAACDKDKDNVCSPEDCDDNNRDSVSPCVL